MRGFAKYFESQVAYTLLERSHWLVTLWHLYLFHIGLSHNPQISNFERQRRIEQVSRIIFLTVYSFSMNELSGTFAQTRNTLASRLLIVKHDLQTTFDGRKRPGKPIFLQAVHDDVRFDSSKARIIPFLQINDITYSLMLKFRLNLVNVSVRRRQNFLLTNKFALIILTVLLLQNKKNTDDFAVCCDCG